MSIIARQDIGIVLNKFLKTKEDKKKKSSLEGTICQLQKQKSSLLFLLLEEGKKETRER